MRFCHYYFILLFVPRKASLSMRVGAPGQGCRVSVWGFWIVFGVNGAPAAGKHFHCFCNKIQRRKKIKRDRFRSALAKLSFLVTVIDSGRITGNLSGSWCLLGCIEDLINYLVHCKFDNTIWIKLVALLFWWKRFHPPCPPWETERDYCCPERRDILPVCDWKPPGFVCQV